MSSSLIGLGIMSGSSLDGIDAVLVDINSDSFRLIQSETIPLKPDLLDRLHKAATLSIKDFLILESEYSIFIGDEINNRFLQSYDFLSIHGHTTHHLPDRFVSNQMVNGGILSAITKSKVVADFRAGDIALGGTGTPMIPIVERNLFKGYDYYLNLGGIANMSIAKSWTAYDVCPCNQLLNFVANKMGKAYDEDGALAMSGSLNNDLFKKLGAFSFYQKEPPKAIDNSWIKEEYFSILESFKNPSDVLHTITKWIAAVIAGQMHQSGSLFITGGGTHNTFLIDCLKPIGGAIYNVHGR